MNRVDDGDVAARVLRRSELCPKRSGDNKRLELSQRYSSHEAPVTNRIDHRPLLPLLEGESKLALLGDEGVDAAGFGVEEVGDRPLLSWGWCKE